MPDLFPLEPRPSMVSAPAIIDSALVYQVDAGYSQRRTRWSRPRRRWTMQYLGLSTADMHIVRSAVMSFRNTALPCSWLHPTAFNFGSVFPSSPLTVQGIYHGLYTGQWVQIVASSPTNLAGQIYSVTVIDPSQFLLNGALGPGVSGLMSYRLYVPYAALAMQEDTLPAPETLIGPEQTGILPAGFRTGAYSLSVEIEELF